MGKNASSTATGMLYAAVDAEKRGDRTAAAKIYRELIEVQPDCAPAYLSLGTLYYQQKRYPEAADYYRRALELKTDYSLAHFNYASTLEELGRFDEAIKSYQRAIEVNPRYCDAHYNLALAYQRAGNDRKSLYHWSAYVRLDSSNSDWVKFARAEIRKLLRKQPLRVVSSNLRSARTNDSPSVLFVVA